MHARKRKPKLLAPVRSFKGLVGVIRAGADEVYCGVTFPGKLRYLTLNRSPACEIPTYNELGRVVEFAHDHNVKVILTAVLPFMAEGMEKEMEKHLRSCLKEGIDALIIGDLGILSLVKDISEDIPLIASTYTASLNYEAVDFLRRMGFSRVILERHLRIHEISEIAQRSKVDIEVFIHGVGCSNINANCYLIHDSIKQLTLRSIKLLRALGEVRGRPACTLPFDVYDMDDRQLGVKLPILDAYQVCSICQIQALVQTRVNGFKIADRCLSEEWQENTTRTYREIIDLAWSSQTSRKMLKKINSLKRKTWTTGLPCKQKRCYYSPLFTAPHKIFA